MELGSSNPTPGGGSVAALCGTIGAALSAMMARLTVGRKKFRKAWESMEQVKQVAEELAERFLILAQEDMDAYQEVMTALKLPKDTLQQKASRKTALQKAMKRASMVPLETLRASENLMQISAKAIEWGNPNALTDAAAALHLARTAAEVAAYNVRINLLSIEDDVFIGNCKAEVAETIERTIRLFKQADKYVNQEIS